MSCLKNKRRGNEFKEGLPECIFFIHKQETHGYDKIHTLRRKRTTKKSLLHGQKENFAVRDQHGQFRAGTMSQEVSSQLRGYSERPVLRRSLVRCQNQLLIKSFNFWRVIYLGSFDPWYELPHTQANLVYVLNSGRKHFGTRRISPQLQMADITTWMSDSGYINVLKIWIRQ